MGTASRTGPAVSRSQALDRAPVRDRTGSIDGRCGAGNPAFASASITSAGRCKPLVRVPLEQAGYHGMQLFWNLLQEPLHVGRAVECQKRANL